jgi:lysophospholipid acyltransferase (LPLAT)-like uncharacterized protein
VTDAGGVRFAWLARLFGNALGAYARFVAATCRVSGPVTQDQVVLAFWHEYNLAALIVSMKRRPDLLHASFSTQGFRGVVITRLLVSSRANIRVLPLPPEGERAAARDFALRMAALARDSRSLVVTPDGPFGPYRVAKPGALIVARAAGLPVQPWAVRVRPGLRMRWRWDRQLLPLPFCRMRLVEGPRLEIAERERLSPRVAELQVTLDTVAAEA